MFTRQLTCQRTACGRAFSAVRRDARFCSRSCRRRHDPPPPPPAPQEAALAADDELNGWRRVGPYLIPPPDPANTFTIW
jgi:hypothetical protein